MIDRGGPSALWVVPSLGWGVLGTLRKQAGQATGSKQVSSILQGLSPGPCPARVPSLTAF